jgi:dipeptidyl aminopeptidase/acylaminoacyl peptidase
MKSTCSEGRKWPIWLFLLVFFLFGGSEAIPQGRIMDLSDLGKEANLSDPRISPDGSEIVLVVSRANYEDNRFENQLVLVDIGTGQARILTHHRPRVRHPRWSPSGDRIAFLDQKDEKEKAQILILSTKGGEAKCITEVERGIKFFTWRPGGKELAFVTEDAPEEKTGEERHNKSFEVGDNVYLPTSQGGTVRWPGPRLPTGLIGITLPT